MCLLLDCA